MLENAPGTLYTTLKIDKPIHVSIDPASGDVQRTPKDVLKYLTSNGWAMYPHGHTCFWTHDQTPGYFTWEQAVVYQMWKRFHLGAV